MPEMQVALLEQTTMEGSEETMKTAAIYARVSTEIQEKEGTSLQTQLEHCLEYCEGKGYWVAHQFSEAFSGLSLERTQLSQLRELVRNEAIDVIVCHSLDRLSRDPVHGVIIMQELEKHNMSLEAVTETVDSTEVGKLITYIRGFASKLEAEKIRERTSRGKKARALSGKLPANSHARLYGYTYIPGRGVGEGVRYINDEQAEIVRKMFGWLLEGLSTHAITYRLRGLDIPTPSRKGFWLKSTVQHILRNPAYYGKTYAFTCTYTEPKHRMGPHTKRRHSGIVRKPREEWIEIPGATPEIVSEEVFNAAQERLKMNQRMATRNSKHEYLLHGHIFCARCGRAYWAAPGIKTRGAKRYEYPFYHCSGKVKIVTSERCDNRQHGARRTEAAIWAEVERVLSNPEVILAELDEIHTQDKVNGWQVELDRVQCQLQNREKQRDRTHKAFYITGDEDTFRRNIGQITREMEGLKEEQHRLEGCIRASNGVRLDAENIKAACEIVKSRLGALSFEDKRLALDALQIRVVVDGDSLTLQGAIPDYVGHIATDQLRSRHPAPRQGS